MFRISRKQPWPPRLDTSSLRLELARIRKDLDQVPDLWPASMMIAEAIEELENADARSRLSGIAPLKGLRPPRTPDRQ